MVFSSIPFLFYFLPVVLILYFAAPRFLKNGVLFLSSLVFYGWGEPRYLALMVFSIVLFYGCGLAIEGSRKSGMRKFWLTLSVVVSVALLVVFKYADFFMESWNDLTGLSVPLLRLALPIGISFYTFQCLSYTIDVYRKNTVAQRNLVDFGAYVALFPQLIAGPIVRYVDVARELENRTYSWENFSLGLRRFLFGLGKKILLADNFALLADLLDKAPDASVLSAWLKAVAFMLNIYFDFSGYSDMAIGLGQVLGFHFPENFRYPFCSQSVSEFWRRWHMTLGGWFRDYVYIPMGGNRVGRLRWLFNILTVWMLTGLWHGAAWNFVAWGLYFAVLLLGEKWLPVLKMPRFLRHIYVLFAVLISFVIFNAPTLSQGGREIGNLFGVGGLPLLSVSAKYYLKSYGLLLALGVLGATPLPKKLYKRIGEHRIGAVLETAAAAVLLLVCTAYLVDGSFSPFLYFRF